MPVEFMQGDILTSDAEAVVIPVNCRGAMGAGLALQAKQKWPALEGYYQLHCRRRELTPGNVMVWYRDEPPTPHVLCAATKDHWRNPSQREWVARCVEDIASICAGIGANDVAVASVAIPALGCGLGGLNWDDVKPLIVMAFEGHPTRAIVYEP